MLIDATRQYSPCSIQIITECAETTVKDFYEGFLEFSKSKISNPNKLKFHSEFGLRSLRSLKRFINSNTSFFNDVLNEDKILNRMNHSQPFTFFKLIYLKFSYYPPKNNISKKIVDKYKIESDPFRKRNLKKVYYWMMNFTERIYALYNVYNDNCSAASIKLDGFRNADFTVSDMKEVFTVTVNYNLVCINVLDYLCHVYSDLQNPGIGSTTSRLALFTVYQLSGCLHQLYNKHFKIHLCLMKHLMNDVPNKFPNFEYKIMNDVAVMITVLQANLQVMLFCISSIVYFTESFLPVTCKITTNRKTSHCFPIEFSVFDLDEKYHYKSLLCFNTEDMFIFYGSVHVGTADFYNPELPGILYQLNKESDNIKNLSFAGEISNSILSLVLDRMDQTQIDQAHLWKVLLEDLDNPNEFDESKVKKATNNLAKFNYFIDKRNKESILQISYLSIYSKVTLSSLNTILSFDKVLKSLKPNLTTDSFTNIISFSYKYFHKNYFDLVYFSIFRITKYIFYLTQLQKPINDHWAEEFVFSYNNGLVGLIKEEIYVTKVLLTKIAKQNPQLNELLNLMSEFSQSVERSPNHYYHELIKIRDSLVNLENVYLLSNIRLSFRRDREF